MNDPSSHRDESVLESTIARVHAIADEVGFDADGLAPFVFERMAILTRVSEVAADGVRMVEAAKKVFAYYDANKPDRAWTPMERRTVVLGSVFSDIGKTGPLDADRDGQRLVAEMFAIEGVKDETQSVAAFFARHFPIDAEDRIRRFGTLGLDSTMSIRAFWNLHASWTFDIVSAGGVPTEAVAAAATHHFLDDVNPNGVVAADGRFSRPFGENLAFDRDEKLVIVLDKYDAARRRGVSSHEGAIAWLRRWIAARERFAEDEELATLVSDVDAALSGSAT